MPVTSQSAQQHNGDQNGLKNGQSGEDNSSAKAQPIKKKVNKKTEEIIDDKDSDLSSSSESELEIEDEENILQGLDLEWKKLQSSAEIIAKENVCKVCDNF